MKKIIKGIILLPMWPLIWKAETDYQQGRVCGACGDYDGCYRRAKAMRRWYNS